MQKNIGGMFCIKDRDKEYRVILLGFIKVKEDRDSKNIGDSFLSFI